MKAQDDNRKITITTDHKYRDILYSYQLTDDEKKELDYLDFSNPDFSGYFFRFKGDIYDIAEFEKVRDGYYGDLKDWHGIQTNSYFSAVLLKFSREGDSVKIARAHW